MTEAAATGRTPRPRTPLLPVLARTWAVVVLVAFVVGVIAYGASSLQTKTYKASGRVFLDLTQATTNTNLDPTSIVRTQSQLAVSTAAISQIAGTLRVSYGDVEKRLSVSPSDAGSFFTISGTDRTPDGAVALVQRAEQAYQQIASSQQASQGTLNKLDQLQTQTQQSIASLQNNGLNDANTRSQIATLQQQLRDIATSESQLRISAVESPSRVELAEAPHTPTKASSPTPLQNAIIGVVLGLLIGIGLVWWRAHRRSAMVDPDAGAELLGAPRLGGLPGVGRRARATPVHDLALAIVGARPPESTILALVPAVPGDLRPDLTIALMTEWCTDGATVVLLDADHAGSGLRDAVTSLAVRAEGGAGTLVCRTPAGDTFTYLPLDPPSPLRSEAYEDTVARYSRGTDLLVLVSPPLAVLPRATATVAAAEAIVVVTTPVTPLPVLAQAGAQWRGRHVPLVGYVYDGGGRHRPIDPPALERAATPAGAARPGAPRQARGRRADARPVTVPNGAGARVAAPVYTDLNGRDRDRGGRTEDVEPRPRRTSEPRSQPAETRRPEPPRASRRPEPAPEPVPPRVEPDADETAIHDVRRYAREAAQPDRPARGTRPEPAVQLERHRHEDDADDGGDEETGLGRRIAAWESVEDREDARAEAEAEDARGRSGVRSEGSGRGESTLSTWFAGRGSRQR